jgi:hydroxypyruvate isomerase
VSERVRFSINLSILYTEVPFLERFERAARAGFGAVEFWWPPADALPELVAAVEDAGLEVVLFNFDAGDMAAGDRGLVNDPNRERAFREHVPRALELAEQLRCPRLNALVGVALPGEDLGDQLARARSHVAWAADQAREIGAAVLIEALNTIENGPYLLSNTAAAAAFVESTERVNVQLQYDVYHMQRMEGNITDNIRKHVDRIGHIQVADAPGRNEPGTGEINFDYVLRVIDELDYDGWVGLEYRPAGGSTDESLAWLPRDLRLPAAPEAPQ